METFLQLFSLFLVVAVGPLVVIFLALTNSKSL
nr:hypothetical chloroplast RF12 [Trentepohlia sp. YN1317]